MKTLFYSPKCNTTCTEDDFFEKMEYASSLGADLIIFGEDTPTPYDELLRGADVLNNDEYNYLLESLYGFCFEIGHGAVFSSTDDFGMRYSIFVNPFAEDGETFNKLYIKHNTDEGSVFSLEDYEKCTEEIFQPIIYKGSRFGIIMGEDIYLPKLFEKYRLNRVNTMICPYADHTPDFSACAIDMSNANNQILLCAGFEGNSFAVTPTTGLIVADATDFDIYCVQTCNSDYAKKCGNLQKNMSQMYLRQKWAEKYNSL